MHRAARYLTAPTKQSRYLSTLVSLRHHSIPLFRAAHPQPTRTFSGPTFTYTPPKEH